MSSIVIKEILDSDNISDLVSKLNFNFDQLIASSGGVKGEQGLQGLQGLSGVQGVRGNEWILDSNNPSDGVLRVNDIRLESDGTVSFYDGSTFVPSSINIKGEQGDQGNKGDTLFNIIKSEVSNGGLIIPNQTNNSYVRLSDHLASIDINDIDDNINNSTFIDNGSDFVFLGRGNNNLFLGRIENFFKTNGDLEPKINGWESEHKDVPMLLISQNDYQDPNPNTSFDELNEFRNGVAIGLNNTHNSYDSLYSNVDEFGNYSGYTNLSIINRNFDFAITSAGSTELRSRGNKLRLSSGFSKESIKEINDISDWSNLLKSDSYTKFELGDSIYVDASNDVKTDNTFNSSKFVVNSDSISSIVKLFSVSNKLVENESISTFSTKSDIDVSSNMISIFSNKIHSFDASNTKYKGRVDITTNNFTSNNSSLTSLNIGQAKLKVDNNDLNFGFIGQGYDNSLVYYSSLNYKINNDSNYTNTDSASLLLPSNEVDKSVLGYNIEDGFVHNTNDIMSDKSLTRMGIFPGFFNQKIDAIGNFDTNDINKDSNFNEYIDDGHKKLPTGSLDLYGTLRIRENGNYVNKEGFIAVNGSDGIVKWEDPNKLKTPVGSIVMVGDIAMDNFNYFTRTDKVIGDNLNHNTNTNLENLLYWAGDTVFSRSNVNVSGWCSAFPGKGSGDWEGYYICNGSVLADTRDVFGRGYFSTLNGINTFDLNNPNPIRVKNEDYYTHFDDYSTSHNISVFTNSVTVNDSDSFATQYLSYSNNFYNNGYSLLSPSDNDSQFRVVLPNYFGRVAKQILPSNESIILAHYDESDGNYIPQLTYYKNVGGIYTFNTNWMLRSGFNSGGYPYIRNENLPIHEHYLGKRITRTIDTSSGSNINLFTWDSSELDSPSFSNGYIHTVGQPTLESNGNSSGANQGIGDNSSNDYYIRYDSRNYDFSNYLDDEIVNNVNAISQKFYDPVYKGTYFAIKLDGLKNPNRNNTIIPDFDFISGVPMCGYGDKTTNNYDFSWYSNLNSAHNGILEDDLIRTTGYQITVVNNTTTIFISPTLGDNVDVKFEPIYRNENTSNSNDIYIDLSYNNQSGIGNDLSKELVDLYKNKYTDL